MKLEKTGPKINYYSHSAACTIQYIYWGFEEADIAYSLVLLSILFNTCAATGGRHFSKTFKNRLEKQQNGCFKLLNSILAVVHTYRQKKAHNTVFSQKKKLTGEKVPAAIKIFIFMHLIHKSYLAILKGCLLIFFAFFTLKHLRFFLFEINYTNFLSFCFALLPFVHISCLFFAKSKFVYKWEFFRVG